MKNLALFLIIIQLFSCERKDKLIANYPLNGNLNDYAMAQIAIPVGNVNFVKTQNTKGLRYYNRKPLSYLILPSIDLNPSMFTICMDVNFKSLLKNNSLFFYGSKNETWGNSGLWVYTDNKKIAIVQNKQVLSNLKYGYKNVKNDIFKACEKLDIDKNYSLSVRYKENTLTVFIDGELYVEYNNVTPFNSNERRALIGIANDPKEEGKFQLNGVVDEIKIYNKALTKGELQKIASNRKQDNFD